MIVSSRTALGIAAILASVNAGAQDQDAAEECLDLEGTPPGLYVTVDQSQVYLVKGDEIVELDPGEAAYASESELRCISVPPALLEWPCGTAEALSRQKAPTYSVATLPVLDAPAEVARRYFEENSVIGPPIEWLNGDFHRTFDAGEIGSFSSEAYWYLPSGPDPFASPKRPRSQLVALFWSTRQAVLDRYTFDTLRESTPGGEIPVVFVFREDNEVPVSFFGTDVTLRELYDAFFNRGIKVAEVPVWYAGDHHLTVSISELEELFDIPALDEISPAQVALLSEDLEAWSFSKKPIAVSMLAESGGMTLDQPERVRVAASLGFESIPTVIFYYSGTSHLDKCGAPLPRHSPVSGAAEPAPAPPPPPERRASDS
jgi:hypothetical protein